MLRKWEGAAKLNLSSLSPNLRSKLVNSVGKVKNKGELYQNDRGGGGIKREGEGGKKVGGGYEIETVFTDSESEVEIGQFGREGQKQRSFGQKSKFDTRI